RLNEGDRDRPGPGLSAMVTIRCKEEDTQTVKIPLTSLIHLGQQSMVWIFEPASETVCVRPVTISQILTDGTAVVSSGLNAGEIVLSAGVHSVKEGEKVKLLPSVSPTNVGGML